MRLGRIERLEHAATGGIIHAAAGVADPHVGVGAGRDAEGVRACRLEHDRGDRDRQCAATGHRVGGVEPEVDEDLLELDRIAVDVERAGGRLFDRDRLRQRPGEPWEDLADELVERDHRLAVLAAARKCEQAAGQPGAALGLRDDLLEVGTDVRRGGVVDEHAGEARDRGEHVVHVMGESRGERADGLHALGVEQLVLQPLALALGLLELGEPLRELVRGGSLRGAMGLRADQRAPEDDVDEQRVDRRGEQRQDVHGGGSAVAHQQRHAGQGRDRERAHDVASLELDRDQADLEDQHDVEVRVAADVLREERAHDRQ
jgi:hypothetical protein